MTKGPNGYIVYEGPSLITGDPIVAIVTGLGPPSQNRKTGPMLQAWILRSDLSPIAAVNTGQDDAICGDCPLRSGSNIGRSCYVVYWLGPHNVWRAYKAGKYPSPSTVDVALAIRGQHLRIGAYGDPAAIPFSVWATLTLGAAGWTGYTHQWTRTDPRFKTLVMASVDTVAEQLEAAAAGWRTFRLRAAAGKAFTLAPNEVVCPASNEAGHRTTCQHCELCEGGAVQAKHVAILPHGQRTKWLSV